MSGVHRLVRIGLGGWLVLSLWSWGLPLTAFWIWIGTQARFGWGRATWQSIGLLLAILAARTIGLYGFEQLLGHRHPLTVVFRGAGLEAVPVGQNLPFILAMGLPFGILMGALANLYRWTTVLPHRWLWGLMGAPVVAVALSIGSLLFYNRIAVPWLGPVGLRVAADPGRVRVTAFVAGSLRRVVHLMGFLWTVVGALVLVGVGGTLLVVLAGHVPAEGFGLEVGLFAIAVVLSAGFWGSGALGLWFELGGRWYVGQSKHAPIIWWQEEMPENESGKV